MYINFLAAPRSLSIGNDAESAVGCVVALVESMIQGKASTTRVSGARETLDDFSFWIYPCRKHGTCVTLSAIGDLHDLLDEHKR